MVLGLIPRRTCWSKRSRCRALFQSRRALVTIASIRALASPDKIVSDSGGGEESLETETITGVQVSAAQDASKYAAPAWSRADVHLDGKSTTVPFSLLNNHVFIKVNVNGKGPFRFIVDTGGHDIVTPFHRRCAELE